MTLVSSVWREVTQKLGLLKALIGFCTIAGEESKRKAEPRTRSASRLSLKTNPNFNTNAPPFEIRGCKVILGGAFLSKGGAKLSTIHTLDIIKIYSIIKYIEITKYYKLL